MKNYLKIILFIAIFITFAISHTVVSFADYTRVTESVNLREKPSTDSKVLKLVPMGYEVNVQNVSGDWTKVIFDGTTGYIRSDFLEVVKGASQVKQDAPQELSAPKADGTAAGGGQSASYGSGSTGVLRFGSEGEAVREVQKLLTEKGYYSGPINAKFGPLTENAVMLFQESMGLEIDGEVGSETMKKLTEKPHPAGTYRYGDEGEEVRSIQQKLKDKGYYSGPVNSKFGPLTEEAVKKFQKANGLEVDGIVGKATLELLNAPPKSTDKSSGGSTSGGGGSSGSSGSSGGGSSNAGSSSDNEVKSVQVAANGVELVDWSEIKKVFNIGVPARVYDVHTGVVYYVKTFSNGNHADVEPVTVEDTAALKGTYGGVWSWTPRPVWVTVNGRTFAGSINGMPHGGGVNDSNGMDGQVCLHFLGGSTHNSNKAYAQLHQDAVMEAWRAAGH